MKIIQPYVANVFLHIPEGAESCQEWLESIGRICYQSKELKTKDSASRFVKMINDNGHHAILEHIVASANIIGDRAMTHELVRHRIASFAEESTRYCNYSKDKFCHEISIIDQKIIDQEALRCWEAGLVAAEKTYMQLLSFGVPVDQARSVLPLGLKSEIVITANLREWLHIFELRCSTKAHAIIRQCMKEILKKLNEKIPEIYEATAKKFISNP